MSRETHRYDRNTLGYKKVLAQACRSIEVVEHRDIPGYEGKYAITVDGRVYSYLRPKRTGGWKGGFRQHFINSRGYAQIGLKKDGITKKFLIHRLVAKVFLPNPEELPEVHHKDFNILNNHLSNLEWVTGETNREYNYRHYPQYSNSMV